MHCKHCKSSEKTCWRSSPCADTDIMDSFSRGTGLNTAFDRWCWHQTGCDKSCSGGILLELKLKMLAEFSNYIPFSPLFISIYNSCAEFWYLPSAPNTYTSAALPPHRAQLSPGPLGQAHERRPSAQRTRSLRETSVTGMKHKAV